MQDTDALMTVRDWLRYAVSRFNQAGLFFGHGTDNAYDEAAYLILHSLHLPLDRLEPFLDARLTVEENHRLAALIHRRVVERIPAAYLTHEAWLGDFRFYVDERVIVPRSYFAEVLENGFSPWIEDPESIESTLDLCTGSGCLAILMAHSFPHALIDGVDISPDALAVAKRNVADYHLEDRIELIQSDVFDGIAERRYDLILSNPPYVTAEAVSKLPQEYLHEPELALGSGQDGLDVVRRILARARLHLNPGGILAVEVGHNRDIVERAFPDLAFTWIDSRSDEGKIFLLYADQLAECG